MKLTKLIPIIAVLVGCSTAQAQVSQQRQDDLTPSKVLTRMVEGNSRFVNDQGNAPKINARIAASAAGQYPKAVILSCLDSRVPVELVFDQGIGDIFVGRVAGNVVNKDLLGSMEFATKLAGAMVVMVLGHTNCGAVAGACDGAEMGNLTQLLAKISPAVEAVKGGDPDQRTSANKKFLAKVIEKNVRLAVTDIRNRSAILAKLEKKGEIKIVGAVYDLKTGKVTLLDQSAK